MRFLADESCDFAVATALRGGGHDVTVVETKSKLRGDSADGKTRTITTTGKDAQGRTTNNARYTSNRNIPSWTGWRSQGRGVH